MGFLLPGVVLCVGMLGAADMMQAHHAAVLVACCLAVKRRLVFEGMAFVQMGMLLLASMRWRGLAAMSRRGCHSATVQLVVEFRSILHVPSFLPWPPGGVGPLDFAREGWREKSIGGAHPPDE